MGRRLYVGNLNYATTADTLRSVFEEDGRTVTDVHVVTDRETGRSRGFAFVELSTDAEAQACVDTLDGAEVDGRTLRVNEAQERRDDRGRGRGGGGGYGGGGGGRGRGRGGYGGDSRGREDHGGGW